MPDSSDIANRLGMEQPADTDVLNSEEGDISLTDLALEKLEPVGAAMSVAKSFVDFSDRFTTVGPERQAELVRYFEGLYRGYSEISSTLRSGGSPEQGCAAVQKLARELPRVFDGILTKEEAMVLVGRLRALKSADRFHEELARASTEGDAGRIYELDRMDKVAAFLGELSRSFSGARAEVH